MTKNDTHDWLALCDEIDDGALDAGLDEIAKACRSRLDIVARRNARRLMRSLIVGSRVRLTNGVKPRYLEGMVGTVTKMSDGAAVVKLDKMPSHTGAGRPPSEGYKDKLLVPLIHLIALGDTPQPSDLNEGPDIGDDAEYEDLTDAPDEDEDDDDD